MQQNGPASPVIENKHNTFVVSALVGPSRQNAAEKVEPPVPLLQNSYNVLGNVLWHPCGAYRA